MLAYIINKGQKKKLKQIIYIYIYIYVHIISRHIMVLGHHFTKLPVRSTQPEVQGIRTDTVKGCNSESTSMAAARSSCWQRVATFHLSWQKVPTTWGTTQKNLQKLVLLFEVFETIHRFLKGKRCTIF